MSRSIYQYFSLILLFGQFIACTSTQTTNETEVKDLETTISETKLVETVPDTIIDIRDSERYATVKIGKQVWLAENLRYDAEGSILNPENPSSSYGRLYPIKVAQDACPSGWHMPTDAEWDELEMAHGMPEAFVGKGGWRGEHAPNLKSIHGWDESGNGINSLGFKVLPAGYYFSGEMGFDNTGLQGSRFSAAFWSATENGVGWARFMFSTRTFVNKWEDVNDDSGSALSCRCVRD